MWKEVQTLEAVDHLSNTKESNDEDVFYFFMYKFKMDDLKKEKNNNSKELKEKKMSFRTIQETSIF